MADVEVKLQNAGDVEIVGVTLQKTLNSAPADIKLYIGELNIFEDMYSPGMYGNILIVDAMNLAGKLNLVGDEWITIKVKTPSMPDKLALIEKKFKVYSITDRQMLSDTGKQSYLLHYCSPELITDSANPLYRTYTGQIDQVVQQIFTKEISFDKQTQVSYDTKLKINGPTVNQVKFTSPGWRPIQCINWLASKSLGRGYKNPGYLFFEGNKSFHFANIEALIDDAIKSRSVYQEYIFTAKRLAADQTNATYSKNIQADFAKASEMRVVQSFNFLQNLHNGYYANTLFSLDLQTKEYNKGFAYDHTQSYNNYKHLEDIQTNTKAGQGISYPPFSSATLAGPGAHLNFYPKHRNLYTGFTNNVADVIENTMPQRVSTLQELNNFKIEITVPGRTDVEVGKVVSFLYPEASPKDETDKVADGYDALYTGYYLITAIRHKFTLTNHVMILELSKDSLRRNPGETSSR